MQKEENKKKGQEGRKKRKRKVGRKQEKETDHYSGESEVLKEDEPWTSGR